MYEEIHNNAFAPRDHHPLRLRDLVAAGIEGLGLSLLLVGALLGLALLALLAGCSGVSPDTYGADKAAVALANTRAGGFGGVTLTAPAIVAGTVRNYGIITGFGAVLLAAGAFVLSQRDLSNGLGFGLLASGLTLLLAGTLLPVYGGWLGLGALAALAAYYWQNHRAKDAPLSGPLPVPVTLIGRLKSLLT